MNRELLLLVAGVLLPINILSLSSRLRRRLQHRPLEVVRLVLLLALVPISLSAIFAFPDLNASKDAAVPNELEELKLKVSLLESVLEKNARTLYSKALDLHEYSKLARDMDAKINVLQDSLESLKGSVSSYSEQRINSLEEQVQKLWAISRKNNFDIHMLESKAQHAEEKLAAVTSETEKMENIITERWIQIQQLEQALQMTKMMTSKVHKRSASKIQSKGKPIQCTVFKFIKEIRHQYLPEVVGLPDSFLLGSSISNSYLSQVVVFFRKVMSSATKVHHELQYFINQAMEEHKFTAAFAHAEVIFCLASLILLLPLICIWIIYSLSFDDENENQQAS